MTKRQRKLGRGLDALMSMTAVKEGAAEEQTETSADRPDVAEAAAADGQKETGDSSIGLGSASVRPVQGERNDILAGGQDIEAGAGARPSVREIAVGQVVRNPHQPRQTWDEGKLDELAASIRANGLIQPILVRDIGTEGLRDDGTEEAGDTSVVGKAHPTKARYQIIAGERRFRACQMAGLEAVPAIVRDASEEQMLEWAIIENIHRADLNPIERARAYRQFMTRFNKTQAQTATRMGEERASVANYVRLLDLPEQVQQLIIEGGLSMGHAKVLLGVVGHKDFDMWVEQAVLNAWSVRHLEEVIRLTKDAETVRHEQEAGGAVEGKSANIVELEKELSRHVGARVVIQPKRGRGHKGKVTVEYYDLDMFDRIKELLMG